MRGRRVLLVAWLKNYFASFDKCTCEKFEKHCPLLVKSVIFENLEDFGEFLGFLGFVSKSVWLQPGSFLREILHV